MINIISYSQDVVYAKVINMPKKPHFKASSESKESGGDMEISCLSGGATKKEWSTGETVSFNKYYHIIYYYLYFKIYGELPQGLLIHVSLSQARDMLKPECVVLNRLGRYYLFEVAVGMNGAIWYNNKLSLNYYLGN